jgi:hypothetical protein
LKKAILCIAACLLLDACSVMSPFRHEPAAPVQQAFDETNEAILVFGLADRHARVALEAGDIIKDSLYRVDWTNLYPVFYGGADNGYVLVKVPADRPIAITSISLENSWTEFWSGGPFQTCKGQKVAVFQVPKGKVLYYSDFDFHPEGRSLLFSATDNFEGAQRFVANNYPQLAGLLQPASFSSLTREDDCQKLRPKATEVAAR